MRRFFQFLLVWLLAVTVACAHQVRDKERRAQLHLKMGTAHLTKGQYPQALSELLIAEELDPDSSAIHNNLALAYLVRDHHEKAEEHAREAVRLAQKNTEARNNLGRILIEQGKYQKAVKELKLAISDLTYKYPEKSHSNLGLAYFRSGQYDQAITQLRKALSYQRKHCSSLIYYGRSLYEKNQYRVAAETLDQALRNCPLAVKQEPQFFAAMSYLKEGESSEALARLEALVHEHPDGKYVNRAKQLMTKIE